MPGMLLYVSLTGHGKIVAFEREIDPATGATIGLAMTHEVPCPEPGALATDPAGRVLFAATDTSELVSFAIDQGTGRLEHRSTVPAAGAWGASEPAQACMLSTDATGRFLFTAAYGGGCVAVFSIADGGSLGPTPVSLQHTDVGSHWAGTDPTNRYVLAPCIARPNDAGNRLFIFKFDEQTGELSPSGDVTPPRPPGGAGENRHGNRNERGPRHIAFNPVLPELLYTSDEQANSVSSWGFDASTGELRHRHSAETLPTAFEWDRPEGAAGSLASEIVAHPTGSAVYVGNRHVGTSRPEDPPWTPSDAVPQTVACFAVDRGTGRLLVEEGSGSGRQLELTHMADALAMDSAGSSLFVAGMTTPRWRPRTC